MPRTLTSNWIRSYCDWIEKSAESPSQYHRWSAATIIAASLKRNVWIDRGSWKLYPNLFTILVGRPGVGKGAALNPAMAILKEAGTANFLSDRITIEYVLEKLSKGFPTAIQTGSGIKFGISDSSAIIFSPELSIFITASTATLPILADLWDAREGAFDYGTRTKGSWKIQSPCLTMLAGSTSEWLISSIPSNAVGGGFTRRVNFVFGKERSRIIPWPVSPNSFKLRTDLVQDLRGISSIAGAFKFLKDAEPTFERYHASCIAGDFDDEATAAYTTSKWAHASKLAICISASRGDSKEISKGDLEEAITEVESCAKDIKMVFRGVGGSDLVEAGDKVIKFLEKRGYATRQDLLAALWQHMSDPELEIVLLTLRNAGMIEESQSGNKTVWKLIPIVVSQQSYSTKP